MLLISFFFFFLVGGLVYGNALGSNIMNEPASSRTVNSASVLVWVLAPRAFATTTTISRVATRCVFLISY